MIRTTSKDWSAWIALVTLSLLAALTLLPVASAEGWPMNHEFNLPWNFNSFYLRTLVYAEHMVQGDWFPIWSVADNNGFGSPQPLMYHKLFYLVSGAMLVMIGHMKASILLSLWLFLMVGASGIYALCRQMGCSRFLSWCGAAFLILANYTVTNWLIRGAMAEFAAAMLVPWVIQSFIRWLQSDTRLYVHMGVLACSLGLLFLAHSVLAFYLIVELAVSFVGLALCRQVNRQHLLLGPVFLAVGILIVVTGPYIGAMRLVGASYDMTRIIPPPFLPENQMKPLSSYFWDTQWQWGTVWDSYTVQLDLPVLALIASGTILWVIQKSSHRPNQISASVDPATLLIIFLIGLSLALQTTWAIPFYRQFPGAAFIQFPWRLLGVITPCLIVFGLVLWQRIEPLRSPYAATLGLITAFWICGVWPPQRYGPTPAYTPNLSDFRFSAFGEYIPSKAGADLPYSTASIDTLLSNAGCTLTSIPLRSGEALEASFELICTQPGIYPLPVFSSPLHQVSILPDENGIHQKACVTFPETPTLCGVQLADSGTYIVRVRFPTFSGSLARLSEISLPRLLAGARPTP